MNAQEIDPYHKWLGIPPGPRPPSHYDLLGVQQFESDVDVICHASDQRMMYVRSMAVGPYAGLSQRLLNEISQAKVCLCNSATRSAYDRQMFAAAQAAVPQATQAAPRQIPASHANPPAAAENNQFDFSSGSSASSSSQFDVASSPVSRRAKRGLPAWLISLAIIGPLLLGTGYLILKHKAQADVRDNSGVIASNPNATPNVTDKTDPGTEDSPASRPSEPDPDTGSDSISGSSAPEADSTKPVEPKKPAEPVSTFPVPPSSVPSGNPGTGTGPSAQTPGDKLRPGGNAFASTDRQPRENPFGESGIQGSRRPAPLAAALSQTNAPIIASFFDGLNQRDLKVTRSAVNALRKAAGTNQNQQAGVLVNRAASIENSMRGFWQRSRRAISEMKAGQELSTAKGSTAAVVEANDQRLVLFVGGKHRRYTHGSDGIYVSETGQPISYGLALLIIEQHMQLAPNAYSAGHRQNVAFAKSFYGTTFADDPSERWNELMELWAASRSMTGLFARRDPSVPESGFGLPTERDQSLAHQIAPLDPGAVRCEFDFAELDANKRPSVHSSIFSKQETQSEVTHAAVVKVYSPSGDVAFKTSDSRPPMKFDEEYVIFSDDRLIRLKLLMKRVDDQIVVESSAEFRTLKGRTRYFPLSLSGVKERKEKTESVLGANQKKLQIKLQQMRVLQNRMKAANRMPSSTPLQQTQKFRAIGSLEGSMRTTGNSLKSLYGTVEDGKKQYESFESIERTTKGLSEYGYVELKWVKADRESPGQDPVHE